MAEIPDSHPRKVSLIARQKLVDAALKSSGFGISHGSEPLTRYPSDKTITGVIYFTAILHASYVAK